MRQGTYTIFLGGLGCLRRPGVRVRASTGSCVPARPVRHPGKGGCQEILLVQESRLKSALLRRKLTVLIGWTGSVSPCLQMTHTQLDRRSLMMHRSIAQRLRADPALLEVARGNMARWNCVERGWWREWSVILQQPLEEIVAVLERDDEEACRLRQSSPFAGILSAQEVWELKRQFNEQHEAA